MQIDWELTNMRSRETRSTHSRMQALFSRIYIGLVIYSLDYNILILDLAMQVRREQRNPYRYMKTKEKIHDKFVRFDILVLMLFVGKKRVFSYTYIIEEECLKSKYTTF